MQNDVHGNIYLYYIQQVCYIIIVIYVKLQVPDGMSPTHSRSYDLSFLPRLLHTKFTAFGRLELELEWCERKILLGWLELELVAGVV